MVLYLHENNGFVYRGTFRMEREDGYTFDCRIPPFSLESKPDDGAPVAPTPAAWAHTTLTWFRTDTETGGGCRHYTVRPANLHTRRQKKLNVLNSTFLAIWICKQSCYDLRRYTGHTIRKYFGLSCVLPMCGNHGTRSIPTILRDNLMVDR